jgi:hypothetical protein
LIAKSDKLASVIAIYCGRIFEKGRGLSDTFHPGLLMTCANVPKKHKDKRKFEVDVATIRQFSSDDHRI